MNATTELNDEELRLSRIRFEEAKHLQVIEGNPLDDENLAMFEMFERERWSHERCVEYIREMGKRLAQTAAEE